MKRHPIALTLSIALAVPAVLDAQTPAAPSETVAEFLKRSLDGNIGPFVQYCGSALPEIKRSLDSEYEQYTARLEEASTALRQKLAGRTYLSAPMAQDLAKAMSGLFEAKMTDVKKQDPNVYCENLQKNVASWTVEGLVTRMEEQFVRLERLDSLSRTKR